MSDLNKFVVSQEHWLKGPGVISIQIHKSWYYQDDPLRTIKGIPAGIMWHWSWTGSNTALGMAKRRQKDFKIIASEHKRANPTLKPLQASSWHVSVEKKGTMVQMVPFNRGSWHAGKGNLYTGPGVKHPAAPNRCLIGVELIGFGDDYPEEQVVAAGALTRALVRAYAFTREQCIHEHRHFAPGRKRDCGEPWTSTYLPRVLDMAGL